MKMQDSTRIFAFSIVLGKQDLWKGLDGTNVLDADCTDVLALLQAAKPIHD